MTSGRCTDRQGYALLVLLLVVGTAVGAASVLIPKRLAGIRNDRARQEETMLDRIRDGLLRSIQGELTIPDSKTWSQAVAKTTGMSKKAVESVEPKFPSDTTAQRLFLIDPGLNASLLPYSQNSDGLTGTSTNLLGAHARLMIVSTSRRGEAMPFSSESVTQDQFDTLWNWAANPATKSPPSGWPASWNHQGDAIHVARIPLKSLFAEVTMDALAYGVGSHLNPGQGIGLNKLIPGSGTYWFLKGTLLRASKLALTGPQLTLNIQRNDALSFSDPISLPTPLAYYPFRHTSQSSITNEGSLGSSWAGQCYYSAWAGSDGPRSPTYTGFSTTNRALNVSSYSALVYTAGTLPLKLPKFTLAGWIRPESISSSPGLAFGVRDALHIGITSRYGWYYIYGNSARGGIVKARYNVSLNTWHHVALVGDGLKLTLYLDGSQVASRKRFVSNYSRLGRSTFRMSDTT
ncbi:MAG: LamG domain-containing protein, partial [Verrucomicrobiales bacterium]|nr:LamG domain-containing protein [Verrucomicrobiales bacterium]